VLSQEAETAAAQVRSPQTSHLRPQEANDLLHRHLRCPRTTEPRFRRCIQGRSDLLLRGQSLRRYLLRIHDPALRAVVVEDGAALAGVGLASLGLLGSTLVGTSAPDALASLLIGLLLAATAFGLARPLADFLVGRAVPAEHLQQVYAILAAAPAVEEVLAFQAVYTSPEEVIVAAKVRPVLSLTVEALTRAMDELDRALRAALSEVAEVYIDVTAYRSAATTTDGTDGRERRPASAPPGQRAPGWRRARPTAASLRPFQTSRWRVLP
jgi:hypothetical protein